MEWSLNHELFDNKGAFTGDFSFNSYKHKHYTIFPLLLIWLEMI